MMILTPGQTSALIRCSEILDEHFKDEDGFSTAIIVTNDEFCDVTTRIQIEYIPTWLLRVISAFMNQDGATAHLLNKEDTN